MVHNTVMGNVNTIHNSHQLHVVLGSGIVGMTLASQLLKRNLKVRIVSRSGRGPEGAQGIALDLKSLSNCAEAVEGATVVYNCANIEYGRWFTDLAPLYRSILSATRFSGASYVLTDNLYMYDASQGAITESTNETPTTPRCILRKELADEALAFHSPGKFAVTLLRASDFYGPGVTNAFLSDRIWEPLSQGKTIDWIGNPAKLHSYAFVPDVARALADLGERPDLAGQAWIAPHASALTARETLELAAKILSTPQPKIRAINRTMLNVLGVFMPMLGQLKDTFYQHERDFVADGSALESKLGWSATSLTNGLRETFADRLIASGAAAV